jgi:hypothetical protein
LVADGVQKAKDGHRGVAQGHAWLRDHWIRQCHSAIDVGRYRAPAKDPLATTLVSLDAARELRIDWVCQLVDEKLCGPVVPARQVTSPPDFQGLQSPCPCLTRLRPKSLDQDISVALRDDLVDKEWDTFIINIWQGHVGEQWQQLLFYSRRRNLEWHGDGTFRWRIHERIGRHGGTPTQVSRFGFLGISLMGLRVKWHCQGIEPLGEDFSAATRIIVASLPALCLEYALVSIPKRLPILTSLLCQLCEVLQVLGQS